MNARFPPTRYPMFFRITSQLCTLVLYFLFRGDGTIMRKSWKYMELSQQVVVSIPFLWHMSLY